MGEVHEDFATTRAGLGTEATAGDSGLFVRQATGLVRAVSPASAFIWNLIPALPPAVLAVSVFWVLGSFRGASLYLAFWLVFVLAAAQGVSYGLLSSAIPRSGGDYWLVGRVLHPALGLVSSFLLTTGQLLSNAWTAWAFSALALGPGLVVLGLVGGSQTLIDWGTTLETSKGWQFGVAAVILALSTLLVMAPWRISLRIQNFAFLAGMSGLALAGLVLLIRGHSGFVSSFNEFAQPFTHTADSYGQLIASAHKQGVDTSPAFSLAQTLPAVGAVAAFGTYNWWSIHIAGEMRRARTWSPAISMVGAGLLTAVIMTVFTAIFFHSFGADFFTAANALNGTAEYPFTAPPVWFFLASIAGGSTFLAWILVLTFAIAWPLFLWIALVQPVRALFSYSFDGLLPSRVTKVSSRSHVPTVAAYIAFLLSLALTVWAVWGGGGFFKVLAFAVLFVQVASWLVSLSAVVLPFRRSELWRASATTRRIGRVPVISLAGLLSLAGVTFILVLFSKYEGLGITNLSQAWLAIAGIAAAAVVLYFGAAAVRRSKGLVANQSFNEIPPE